MDKKIVIFITALGLFLASLSMVAGMKVARLDEEDQDRVTVPFKYRCDACRGIVYYMFNTLYEAETGETPPDPTDSLIASTSFSALPNRRRLKMAHYYTLLSDTCNNRKNPKLDEFGVWRNGKVESDQKLNGPGLRYRTDGILGSTISGGKWGGRMSLICNEMITLRDMDEDEFYQFYTSFFPTGQTDPNDAKQAMFKSVCIGEDSLQMCTADEDNYEVGIGRNDDSKKKKKRKNPRKKKKRAKSNHDEL